MKQNRKMHERVARARDNNKNKTRFAAWSVMTTKGIFQKKQKTDKNKSKEKENV